MTPRELSVMADGYVRRQEIHRKESIYQAYLISRWVWQKKVDIKKILGDNKSKRHMTDDEMYEQAKRLNAMFGGEVVGML